jgi:selenide,water dikinase
MPSIVLAGGGHAHALVLHAWARRPPRAQVTLVSEAPFAAYSGMLPGEVAGHYRAEETRIDLARLCRDAGAAFVEARVTGIDRSARQLLVAGGGAVPYTLLSLNVGAVPGLAAPGAAEHATPVKPVASFRERWEALRRRVLQRTGPATLAVVGAGAAGVELALALQWRLQRELGPARGLRVHLLDGAPVLLPSFPPRARRAVLRLLAQRGIDVHLGSPVEAVGAGFLRTAGGLRLEADEIVWVTQAQAPAWLRDTGLALDGAGFVRVQPELRSVTDPCVFAAGDVASVEGLPPRKSGVVAVRQAPVLARNLVRTLAGEPLQVWQPQRHWLSILAAGDRYAVATRGPFTVAGRWVWHWKDRIDRRFVRQFEGGA